MRNLAISNQRVLAIDTFGLILSVAVSNGNEIYYSETDAKMRQSELVMDCIDNLMKKASLKPSDLEGVICMGGPGSFTGLRIGYSIAKGLALSLSIPFAPVPTLDCLAFSPAPSYSLLCTLIEARKNSYFYAFFRDGIRVTPDKEADSGQILEEIRHFNEEVTLTGPGSAIFYDSLQPELRENIILDFKNKGYAKEIIVIAQNTNILHNDNNAYLYSGPDYIRKSDAELNILFTAN